MQVIIAPATPGTDGVLRCLQSWSGAGLLGRFCLWQVALDRATEDARDVVLVDSGTKRSGTLSEVLKGTPTERIVLLAFYAADADEGFDTRFRARVDECLRLTSDVLAYDKLRPVECTTIVAPGRTAQPVPAQVFGHTRNLYVAPEDRSSPRAANQLPDSDGFLPRHGAHALATLADLWADAELRPSGVLEAIAAEDSFAIDPPAVRVARCFSRVLDFGYVADHVAADVFQAGEEWPNPDPAHFDRVNDPGALVKRAVRDFMQVHGEALGLSEFDPVRLPPERRPNLLEALRELLGMLVARIRRLPFELEKATIGAGYDMIVKRVDKLRGPDAPRTLRWRERPQEEQSIGAVAEEIDRPISLPDGPVAAVWRDLRQTIFSLVDGSEPPADIAATTERRGGKRELVTRPAALVPDPLASPPNRPVERACDPLALDPGLADAGSEEKEGAEETDETLATWLQSRRPTLLWGVGYRLASNLKAARAAASALEAENDVGVGKAEGGEEGAEAVDDTEKAEEAGSTRESRWRRMRNSLLLRSGLAAIASFLAWSQLAAIPALIGQAVVVAAWVLGFMTMALKFVRTERSILRAEAEGQLEIANRAIERAVHAGDVPRLERRYAEYLDWAEIVGSMVHRPWVGEPIERVRLGQAISNATLPAALQVGVAAIPEQVVERLSGQARATVFRPSWLGEHYRSVTRDAMDRVEQTRSYAGSGGSADPDADNLDDPDSPRRQLLAAIRRGDGRHLRDNEMTDEVLGFIDRVPLEAAAREVWSRFLVRSDDEETLRPQALPPCAAWFAPPASLPDVEPGMLAVAIKVAVDSASGPRVGLGAMLTPEGLAVTSHEVVAGATSLRVRLADDSQCEATIVASQPEFDLALLRLDGAPQLEKPLGLAGSPACLGDPILAPTPPGEAVDAPAMALGLVTADLGKRQAAGEDSLRLFGATYRSAAGRAGSPVFDLAGNLVGIHGAVAIDEAIGNLGAVLPVTPAAAVERLLATAERAPAEDGASTEPSSATGNGAAPAAADFEIAKPTEFIGELFAAAEGPVGLLPRHWVDPDDQHLTETVGEPPAVEGATVADLSTGARFMQPLRAIVHRVDMTQAMAARELASCSESRQEPVETA